MKTNIKRIASISVILISVLLLLYSLYAFFATTSQISSLVKAQKVSWGQNRFELLNFILQSSTVYLVYSIILGYIGYNLLDSNSSTNDYTPIDNNRYNSNVIVEEKKKTTTSHPLTLVDGSVKTNFIEYFETLEINYMEAFFDTGEKLEAIESFVSQDGEFEVTVFDYSNVWKDLKEARKTVCNYYEQTNLKNDEQIEDEKLAISKVLKFGKAQGFYAIETDIENEGYLILSFDNSIYLVRLISSMSVEELIPTISKIRVTL